MAKPKVIYYHLTKEGGEYESIFYKNRRIKTIKNKTKKIVLFKIKFKNLITSGGRENGDMQQI